MKGSLKGILIVTAILGALIVIAIASVPSTQTPEQVAKKAAEARDGYFRSAACSAAQKAVTAQLKAPATAEFPGCILGLGEYSFRTNKERTTFIVTGYVDAQNSFGAKLRNNFTVGLARKESQEWQDWPDWEVLSVNLLE